MTSLDDAPPQAEEGFDVPPSLARLLLAPAAVTIDALLAGASRVDDSWVDALVVAVPYLVGGLVLLGYRRRRRRRPVRRIDALGVINHEGQRIHRWPHTAQVWVGPTPSRWIPTPLRLPTLVAWTDAGVEFGRRAHFGPTAALNLAVPTGLGVDQLAVVVRRFAAPVLTASEVELGDLTRRLLRTADRE